MKHLQDELEAYLEGWLTAEQRRMADEHLAHCAQCRETLEEQRQVKQFTRLASPEVPTERMWKAIQARLDAGEGSPQSESFWEKWGTWWVPARRWGLAVAVASALAVYLWGPKNLLWQEQPLSIPSNQDHAVPASSSPAPQQAVQTHSKPKTVHRSELAGKAVSQPPMAAAAKPIFAQAQPAKKRVMQRPAALEAEAAPAPAARAEGEAGAEAMKASDFSTPMLPAEAASYGSASFASALAPRSAELSANAPVKLPAAQGGLSADGSWNWDALQLAFNQANWPQVAAELKAARQGAAKKVERSFASSALNLLSSQGQPLASLGLNPESDAWNSDEVQLVVLQAKNWRFNGPAKNAVFQGSVMTREKGLRSAGSEFVMDLGNEKGVFTSATDFTRLAGEQSVRILDAAQSQISANHFSADNGASYDYQTQTLQLNR